MVDRDKYKQVRQDPLHACNEFPPSTLLLVHNSTKNKKGKSKIIWVNKPWLIAGIFAGEWSNQIMHMDIIFSTVT